MRINETFFSLQGEGKFIGVPTYFVRSVGCNLRCSWCDTTYAFEGGTEMSVDEIMERIGSHGHVCLTGGEPLLHKEMYELIDRLIAADRHITIETNGSVDLKDLPDDEHITVSMDIKCPSSGMQDKMCWHNLSLLKPKDQLKFVIADETDYRYSVGILDRYRPDTEVIFSAVGGMNIRPLAEHVIESGLKVRVLPQLHKIIWGDRTGV